MIKTRTEQVIDVGDWDNLVVNTYGRPYSFQQQDGCKDRSREYIIVPTESPWDYENATVPEEINGEEMGVSFKAWIARDPKEWDGEVSSTGKASALRLFWQRNFYPSVQILANDLHAKGLLPAGRYTIHIDW